MILNYHGVPPSFCGHAIDGSKNKKFNTKVKGKRVLHPHPLSPSPFLKTTFFFNCQDFLDATVYTFKNDTMLRAWLFYI